MNTIGLNKTVIVDSRFEQHFAAISDDALLQPAVQKELYSYLDACAQGWAVSGECALAVENELAPLTETLARDAVNANRSQIENLKTAIQGNHASWLAALLLATAWALMIAAEWCLNQGVLPWIVGASGFAAVALAGAPSLTPLIFDRIFGALFGNEPWVTGVPQLKARKCLLAAIGVLNLVAVGMVGGCRGLVAALRNTQSAIPLTSNQSMFVDSALVMLSFVLALDAAVIFLYFSHELIAATARDRTLQELNEAEKAQSALDTAVQQARRNGAEATKRFTDGEKQVESLRAEFLAERRLLIAARIAKIVQTKDYQSVVEMREKTQFFRETEAA